MAKNSAASKGYRRSAKKKPYLTKKEIGLLIAIIAAIIAAVVLFNVFYGRGYLKASDVQENDVVSIVSRDLTSRYAKLAEANQLDGFTRTDPNRDVNPAADFSYAPDEPVDNISSISLGASYSDAADLADSHIASMQEILANNSFVSTERDDITVQGHDAYVYSYTYDYYKTPADAEAPAEDENPESNTFNQNLSLYLRADGGRTVYVHIFRTGEDDSFYLDDGEIADYIAGYADKVFTLYGQSES